MLNNLSESQRLDLIAGLASDPVIFNSIALPEMFDIKIPKCHRVVYEALANPNISLVIVNMPRGFGKTTILQGFLTQQVVNQLHKVILYISDTWSQAAGHTESIRMELEDNERIQSLYGPQIGRKWTAEQWTTANGVSVLPKGVDQSLRGIKIGRERPSLVIIDDPENDINSLTPEQNEKLWQQLFGVIKPMMGSRRKSKIVWLGTYVNENCVLLRLMKLFANDPEAKIIELAARDDDKINYSWPELWPKARLDKEERQYASAGMHHVFCREYLGKIISREDAIFNTDKTRFYNEGELPNDVWNYITVDCAYSESQRTDYSAMVVFSASPKTRCVYVREAYRERVKPDVFLKEILRANDEYRPMDIFLQRALVDMFFRFYADEHYNLPFTEITISRQKDAKTTRIASMQPLFKTGRLQFLPQHTDLIGELTLFPRAAHDDLSDSLAAGIQNITIPGFHRSAMYTKRDEPKYGTWEWASKIKDRQRQDMFNKMIGGGGYYNG